MNEKTCIKKNKLYPTRSLIIYIYIFDKSLV